MTELSPQAQAVLEAFLSSPEDADVEGGLAAALRVVADQVLPEEPLYGGDLRWMWERDARQACRKKLLAIADELEAQ